MSKSIIVAGYGPGISHAVAVKFGSQGFAVTLAARNAGRLDGAVRALEAQGITALGVPTDLSRADAVNALVARAREAHGPITVLHWNAAASVAGDVVTAPVDELRLALDTGVVGLVVALQAALADLKAAGDGAVLVTDGGFGQFVDGADHAGVASGSMGLAIANSAKHKLVRMLAKRLASEGVFAGEVMVLSTVKGTAWDSGQATLDPADVAERFWNQYRTRSTPLDRIPGER